MTIDNIALVRATNVIPFDGRLKPISESPYLIKNTNTLLAFEITNLLRNAGLIEPYDYKKAYDDENYDNEYNERLKMVLKDYLPYISDYNSMILFSLNGLVPDDSEGCAFGNNTFSNKKCGIIDGLKEHIDQVISLVPTDTAIKGSMELSSNAIILLEKSYYESLSNEQKDMLSNLNIKLFEGSLKEAVKETLKETGRYIPEDLSLRRGDRGYKDSDTKEETVSTIDSIARERNIAQVLHLDVITGHNDDLDKLEDVKDEQKNIQIVMGYYQNQFYEYLFQNMHIEDEYLKECLMSIGSPVYINKLGEKIKEFGLENYKKLVEAYNKELERMQSCGELLTPDEIVKAYKKKDL